MMLARRYPSDRVGSLMERFFNDALGGPPSTRGNETASLPFDMYEVDSEVVIRAAVPGVQQDDVSLTVDHGRLTIRAKRDGHAVEGARWLHREVWPGEYARSFVLPSSIQGDKATATYDDGILTVRIPKADSARPKEIKIEAKAS